MSEPTTSEPRRLGDFEIVRELGRGGMGVVYEARQMSLKRKVALKVLSGQLGLTSQAVVRFRREAEAAAKLHHTNIVPIYATGEENGTHYYAMELVEGPSLNIVIRELRRAASSTPGPSACSATEMRSGPGETLPSWVLETVGGAAPARQKPEPGPEATGPDVSDRPGAPGSRGAADSSTLMRAAGGYFDTIARLIAEVADALDYAHKQGVIHRDIKPSNLLLSPAGRLSINDFGLARVLEQPGMTMTGEFMGTPRYMSPEQIAAGRAPLDHRTDIYSLGATLYELLTLEPPFPGERREQMIAQIIAKDPVPPRRLNKRVPVDLETICLKALEKDPDRRYQTAGQMAADLQAYVNRFAISAKRAGPITRLGKWCRRRPAVAVLLGVVIALAGAAGLSLYGVARFRARVAAVELQRVIDDAMVAAMNGNVVQAEARIAEAELRGASAGWVRMLRGQLVLHQGNAAEAVQHLEQAVRLLPDSAAAHGLLAYAYQSDGQSERLWEILLTLERLPLRTAEDFLFKGYAESTAGVPRALPTLDEAVRQRDSGLARLIRSNARVQQAFNSADPGDAALAMEDAAVARIMLPDSPYALWNEIRAQVLAAGIFGEQGQETERASALALAERDVRALERFVGVNCACAARVLYFDTIGDAAAVMAEARAAMQAGVGNYAEALCLHGNYQEALDLMDLVPEGQRGANWKIHRAFAVALMPDGQARLAAAYRDCMKEPPTGVWAIEPPRVLLLLGLRSDAISAARESRSRAERMVPWLYEWYGRVLDYDCGLISDDELLAAAGRERLHQCEAHFYIALMHLADGDRTGAAEHFRACIRTRIFDYIEYGWSRAFLARMDQDPAWPAWIPVRDSPSSRPESRGSGTGRKDGP